MRHVCTVVLFLVAMAHIAVSIEVTRYGHWGGDSGAINTNDISCVAIDCTGVKWFGTYIGIRCYDGALWTSYTQSNSGLADDRIYDIVVDSSNTKWIGTDAGLSVYDGTTWDTYTDSISGFGDNTVDFLTIDSEGNIWFGTHDVGFFWCKFNGSTLVTYDTTDGLPLADIRDMAVSRDGILWAATWKGACRFTGSRWIPYTEANSGLSSNDLSCIAIDASGTKWMGTSYEGVIRYDGENWTTYNAANSGLRTRGDMIYSILIDDSGNVWAGGHNQPVVGGSFSDYSDFGALNKYNGAEWIYFKDPELYVDIVDMEMDTTGTLWCATTCYGVLKVNTNTTAVVQEHSNKPQEESPVTIRCNAGVITARGISAHRTVALSLYTVNGRCVYSQSQKSSEDASVYFRIPGLTPGSYICRVQQEGHRVARRRIVVW